MAWEISGMDYRPGLPATILMEWGERGAAAICPGADYVVIVDVLSFTTSSIAKLNDLAWSM